MQKSTDTTVLSDREGEAVLDEDANSAKVGRLTARLAGSDLDPESLEMIMAALTADACDEINPA